MNKVKQALLHRKVTIGSWIQIKSLDFVSDYQ